MQYVVNAYMIKWKPKFEFSFTYLKILYSFGLKLLYSTLTETICDNLMQLIIDKKYSIEDIAFIITVTHTER